LIRFMSNNIRTSFLPGLILLLSLSGCGGGGGVNDPVSANECIIPKSQLADGGVGKDGIPALTDPKLVSASEISYLTGGSRVIGIEVDGQAIAVPHNILWSHEIANFSFASGKYAVTYCPLTGSSMAFNRSTVGGAEFGVSGLLFQNNLTMYDRNSGESLWPQMLKKAGCGPAVGTALEMMTVIETNWAGWQELYPDTKVLSSDTGFRRDYTQFGYPYGDYERETNARVLFSQTIDDRRPPKERLLGVPAEDGGIAFPFNELNKQPLQVAQETVDGSDIVVFWDRSKKGAMAFRRRLNGQVLTFSVQNDSFIDQETGSTWRMDGRASGGALAGQRLEPIAEAFVAFWFAWADFEKDTRIWTAE
jgi:Protein of unknown function (DUF3179)